MSAHGQLCYDSCIVSKFFKANSGDTSFSEVPKHIPSSTELHLSDSDDARDGMDSMS